MCIMSAVYLCVNIVIIPQLLAAFFYWQDPVWPVVSSAAGKKECPDRVRLGLASQKELNHERQLIYYQCVCCVLFSVCVWHQLTNLHCKLVM